MTLTNYWIIGFVGVFATVVIDIWAIVLKYGFHLPTTDWAMVGRWFGHIPRGNLIHRPIRNSPAIPYERVIGWTAHYVIGILYAFLYLFIIGIVLTQKPSLVSAMVFGIATLVAPWFLLQPGLGLGIFASRAQQPNTDSNYQHFSAFSVWSLTISWLVAHRIFDTVCESVEA